MDKPVKLKTLSEKKLRSVDPETIPDELLRSWWFRHIAKLPRGIRADPESAGSRKIARERKQQKSQQAAPVIPEHFPREGLWILDPRIIPEDLLKSWWARRNGKLSGPARIKDDPATEPKRQAERERVRKYREKLRAIADGKIAPPEPEEPKERCYCQKNTMKRAKSRAFECCKQAGVTIPKRANG